MRYYHGGVGHLQKHQILLQVPVTPDAHAAFEDAVHVHGESAAVYEVKPGFGYARVVRVVQVLTKEERDDAARRLTPAEFVL